MCTAFSLSAGDHYFGRNLDLDHHYDDAITISPRGYRFPFRHTTQPDVHFAIIGVATITNGYPLYYDATNEKGLSMAALNFPGNAVYRSIDQTNVNIASFELIPWVLSQCQTVSDAKDILEGINLCDTAFQEDLPTTPLHWIISDKDRSITVEPMHSGLIITDNPFNILTNNPPFSFHANNITNYMHLSSSQPQNCISSNWDLSPFSSGMGAIGLPGDFSSPSRFVRCGFLKENIRMNGDEEKNVGQIFHILDFVSQLEGCVQTPIGFQKTIYSICCNASKGVYYFTTYNNRQITAVDMHRQDLTQTTPIAYPLIDKQTIHYMN